MVSNKVNQADSLATNQADNHSILHQTCDRAWAVRCQPKPILAHQADSKPFLQADLATSRLAALATCLQEVLAICRKEALVFSQAVILQCQLLVSQARPHLRQRLAYPAGLVASKDNRVSKDQQVRLEILVRTKDSHNRVALRVSKASQADSSLAQADNRVDLATNQADLAGAKDKVRGLVLLQARVLDQAVRSLVANKVASKVSKAQVVNSNQNLVLDLAQADQADLAASKVRVSKVKDNLVRASKDNQVVSNRVNSNRKFLRRRLRK